MSTTTNVDMPMFDLGDWIAEQRHQMDGNEAVWLDVLADFDATEAWRDDGQLPCVDWLMWRTKMARSTCFEKLRIAHQLRLRPLVAAAFAAGDLSYSAVRAITRLERPRQEVDEALIELAKSGTVAELEWAVRHYRLCQEQDEPPPDPNDPQRGVRLNHGLEGHGRATIDLTNLELEELRVAIRAFLDLSSAADDKGDPAGIPQLWWTRHADAFMDIVRTALAHAKDGQAMGADRYLVHAVVDVNQPDRHQRRRQLINGIPLDSPTLEMIGCDASTVLHEVDGNEPLNLGRKTRDWNTAQRRAITVRDGGRCRFPGCQRRIADIHHLHFWEDGGPTDIANGALLCNRHHHIVHRGYAASGNANEALEFRRPDGTLIDTTTPPLH